MTTTVLKTQSFRAQHAEILAIAKEIAASLQPATLAKDADRVRMLLAKLAGVLNVHLAMEDKSLYPNLLASPKTVAIAKRFMDEMGTLAGSFKSFMGKWPNGQSIQRSSSEFAKELTAIFDAIAKRIQREEKELYPLVDGQP